MTYSSSRAVTVLAVAWLLGLAGAAVEYRAGAADHPAPQPAERVQFKAFAPQHHRRPSRQTGFNQNETVLDDHSYYTSTFYPPGAAADGYWNDISQDPDLEEIIEAEISDRFRFYMVHPLPFNFSFYGHIIDTVAITTGGFLYTGTFYFEFIHLTQYIAPLQADFNPGLNDSARILISASPERFTVQWNEVHNNDHVENGTFTFQVTLFPDGQIVFAYREVPLNINDISALDHPVEVGVSDSFYVDEVFPGPVLVRSIYEYHRVRLNASQSLAFSAYLLTPLPNCVMAASCGGCQEMSSVSDFECGWCPDLQRCSDGVDRFRQEWFTSGCLDTATSECKPTETPPITTPTTTTTMRSQAATSTSVFHTGPFSLGAGAVVGVVVGCVALLLLGVLLGVCVGVLLYGYRTPTSKLGMYMIEHRPGARTLNKTSNSASYSVESGKTILEEQT